MRKNAKKKPASDAIGKLVEGELLLSPGVGSYAYTNGKSAVFIKVDRETFENTGIRRRLREAISEGLGDGVPVVILPDWVDYSVIHVG